MASEQAQLDSYKQVEDLADRLSKRVLKEARHVLPPTGPPRPGNFYEFLAANPNIEWDTDGQLVEVKLKKVSGQSSVKLLQSLKTASGPFANVLFPGGGTWPPPPPFHYGDLRARRFSKPHKCGVLALFSDWQAEYATWREHVELLIEGGRDRLMSRLQESEGDAAEGGGAGKEAVPAREVPPCPHGGPWLPVERAVLKALYYRGRTLDALASSLCKPDGTLWSYEMIRKATLKGGRLRKCGVVDNKRGVGYYRTDALPGQEPKKEPHSGVSRV